MFFGRRTPTTTVTSATVVFHSTTVPETPPAPSKTAVAAANAATQMPGGFLARPTPSHPATESDRQRSLPLPPPGSPPTESSAVSTGATSESKQFDAQGGDTESRQSQRSRRNDMSGET